MAVGDWFFETFGRANDAAIYDGMPLKDRRNPRKRTLHFMEAQQDCERAFDKFLETSKKTGDNFEAEVGKYYNLILKSLYAGRSENDLQKADSQIESATLTTVFSWLHTSNDLKGKAWSEVFKRLRLNRVAKEHLPALFDGRGLALWNEIRQKREMRERLLKEGAVQRYRMIGTTQTYLSNRGSFAILDPNKQSFDRSVQNWSDVNNYVGGTSRSTEGTLLVTIAGLDEFKAGTFKSQMDGRVNYEWLTGWRPKE